MARDVLKSAIGRPVSVQLADSTVGGRLVDLDDRSLVLTDAVAVPTGADAGVPADGQLVIARAVVTWVQVLEA